MNKKLPKKAGSKLVKNWDSARGELKIEKIPMSGDYDADNEATIKAAKARLGDIEKLLAEPHSSSGLTNKKASVLAREKRQLETFIR
jgi:hypothetical protein